MQSQPVVIRRPRRKHAPRGGRLTFQPLAGPAPTVLVTVTLDHSADGWTHPLTATTPAALHALVLSDVNEIVEQLFAGETYALAPRTLPAARPHQRRVSCRAEGEAR